MTGNGVHMATMVIRVFSAARGAWGLALLGRPGAMVRVLAPEFPTRRSWLVRVLGARVVLESAALLARPDRTVLLTATGVDTLHAASMLPCLFARDYRRAALISGAGAAASAAVLGTLARRSALLARSTSRLSTDSMRACITQTTGG